MRSSPRPINRRSRASGGEPPPFPHPVQAVRDGLQIEPEFQARGGERRPAVVGEGAAHRGRSSPAPLRPRSVAALQRPLDRADAARFGLSATLGVAVGLEHRVRRLAQEVELAEPGGTPGNDSPRRGAPRLPSLTSPARQRPRPRPPRRATVEVHAPTGQQLRASSTSPERQSRTTQSTSCPDVGLLPSRARRRRAGPSSTRRRAPRAGQVGGQEFVVAVEQGLVTLRSAISTPRPPTSRGSRDAAVVAVAHRPNQGDHVQPIRAAAAPGRPPPPAGKGHGSERSPAPRSGGSAGAAAPRRTGS